MGLGDRLTSETYKPKDNHGDMLSKYVNIGVGRCPVKFTEDPIEYCESKEYLGLTLRPKQKEFVEDLYSVNEKGIPNYSEGVFIAGMRCHGLGTPILMYDGTIKNIEDIIVGDQVMGPDSKPRNVLGVCSGEDQLYTIKQNRGMSYVVNSQHILSLKYKKRVKGQLFSSYINVPVQEYLANVNKYKNNGFGWKPTKPFSFKDTYRLPDKLDPYILGLWIADGCGSQVSFSVNHKDIEIIDYIKYFAKTINCQISYHDKQENSTSLYIPAVNNPMLHYLKEMHLLNNKHIPYEWRILSVEDRLQLLAGYLDGDGCLTNGCFFVSTASKPITDGIILLARSLSFNVSLRFRERFDKRTSKIYKSYELSIYGNVESIPTKLARKQKFRKRVVEANITLIHVIDAGFGKFAGISIDGDHLYCLSEGTVTHNSGKSAVAGMIATFQTHKLLAFDDPAGQLGQLPLDRLTVQCIAASQEQAGETIYAKVESMVNGTYWWRKYVEWLQKRETATGGKGTGSLFAMFTNHIEFFEKNVGVLALHSNSSALAGKTSACCIFDELSRFDVAEGNIQQKSQKRTAQAVYNTSTRAATSLMPFSKVVTITSPMYEDDYGMQLLLKAGTFKGGAHSAVVEALRTKEPIKAGNLIGYHFTTFEVNPGYAADGSRILGGCDEKDDFFISKKEQDPEAYRRDYLAIPPSAISPFIEYPERLLSCLKKDTDPKVIFSNKIIEDTAELNGAMVTRRYIAKDILITRPDRMTKYYLCCDQGLSKDSFVVAMGHGEEFSKKEIDSSGKERDIKAYKIIVDFVEKWVPDKQNRLTVNFQNVEDIILALSKAFNITSVCYDQWNSASSIQALFSQGVYTEKIGATLEMYEILKQMIYTSLIVMPDDSTLVKEIRQLNLIKNIRIDHPAGGSKDSADATVRVAWKLYVAYIKDAYQGNYMLGKTQRFPTIRSVATQYDMLNQQQHLGVQQGGVFGGNFNGGQGSYSYNQSSSIFDGSIVRPNVVPNIDGE